MSRYRKLTTACLAAALALGLAACGSSGDSTKAPDPGDTTPPVNVADLFVTAQESRTDAEAASKAAADAVKTAMEKADELTTAAVAGDSGQAMKNAQAILDADMAAKDAVTDAQTALNNAKAAKTKAGDLADTDANKATLIAALDEAIKVAEEQLEAAKKSRDGRDLEAAVEDVTGGPKADPQGTPRSIADAVGTHISNSLIPDAGNDNTNGLGRDRGTHGTDAPATTIAKEHKVIMDDAKGQTWAEIVGEGNLMTKPIGENRAGVKVTSVAGKAPAKVWATVPGTITALGTNAATDGATFENANYSGIPGAVYCLGTDCKVTDGKLAGSWYFAQTAANAATNYVTNPDKDARATTPYVAETLYAMYGHWILLDGTNWNVNTFATTQGTGSAGAMELGASATLDDNDKATYSGSAAGMSVYKTPKASGTGHHIDSGRFTADVSLNASFGPSPTIRGSIKNFQGDAVGDWTVTLESATLASSSNTGNAVATGRDGSWSATAYGGVATARPVGIIGGFSAHFSDGHAAGAYATRKD